MKDIFGLFLVLQLALRTVNSSRSAYACYLFAPGFFMQFNANTPQNGGATGGGDGDEEEEPFRCKITMKVREEKVMTGIGRYCTII